MPRYDSEPEVGFPLPSELVRAVKVRDEHEVYKMRIQALAQELAQSEEILRHKVEAAASRAAAGIKEPEFSVPTHTPGMGLGPMNISSTGPPHGGGVAELAGSPFWYKAVELAVQKLGLRADKLALRAEALRTWSR
jgi:hypothetical protein